MRADDPPRAARATYTALAAAGRTLTTTADERGGAKLATMDVIGLAWQ
jgi:hypothetical protein